MSFGVAASIAEPDEERCMTGRILFRFGGGVLAIALLGCATPVDDVGAYATPGQSSTCSKGSCDGCTSCYNMCTCGGGTTQHCSTLCASSSGGSGGSVGGSGGTSLGGSGGLGGYDAGTGAQSGFGGTSYGGSGGTQSCGVSVGDPICDSCLQSQCCLEAETCVNDSNCISLMNCLATSSECMNAGTLQELLDCGDTACPSAASGKPALSGYFSCLATRCSGSC